ncbi:IS3 family transposase [Streptomyces sp. NPDC058469]|uniref:IS3 family transposase n=1 Tax=Streptomyces sp. NPDC058469 TaxID=3346514 RepID=UPI00365D0E69
MTEKITAVHERSRGTDGVPRIHAILQREGVDCGRRRITRLMRTAGLQGRHRRRRQLTTIPDPRAAVRPDVVVRDFAADRDGLDSRWCGDITYIPTEEGGLYLATVIDIASRRVVGWYTADHLRTELVADALQSACRERRPAPPVIFHSGHGCQYTSQQFASLATELGDVCPSTAPGSGGTTRSPSPSSPPSKGSCSTQAPGPVRTALRAGLARQGSWDAAGPRSTFEACRSREPEGRSARAE